MIFAILAKFHLAGHCSKKISLQLCSDPKPTSLRCKKRRLRDHRRRPRDVLSLGKSNGDPRSAAPPMKSAAAGARANQRPAPTATPPPARTDGRTDAAIPAGFLTEEDRQEEASALIHSQGIQKTFMPFMPRDTFFSVLLPLLFYPLA